MENRIRPRKIIVSIIVPVYLFIFAALYAEDVSVRGNAFELESTWWIWIIYFSISAYWFDIIFTRRKK